MSTISWCVSYGSDSIGRFGKDPLEGKKQILQDGLSSLASIPGALLPTQEGDKYGHVCICAMNGRRALWVMESRGTEPEPTVLPALLGSLVGCTNVITLTSTSSQPPNMLQSLTKVILPWTVTGGKRASLSLYCTFFSSIGQNSMNISPS